MLNMDLVFLSLLGENKDCYANDLISERNTEKHIILQRPKGNKF